LAVKKKKVFMSDGMIPDNARVIPAELFDRWFNVLAENDNTFSPDSIALLLEELLAGLLSFY
jgi:hypothetical protein